jgi:hypothetical protein
MDDRSISKAYGDTHTGIVVYEVNSVMHHNHLITKLGHRLPCLDVIFHIIHLSSERAFRLLPSCQMVF